MNPCREPGPVIQLRAFETPSACLVAALVRELAAAGSTVDQERLRERWIERWPALAHGVGNKSVPARVGGGLRMLEAVGAVRLDEHAGTIRIADPKLLAMAAANQAIVTRPDGSRVRPQDWSRIPTVPEHLVSIQRRRHRTLLDGTVVESGPLVAEAHTGYSLAVRSRPEFAGTIATCDASVRLARWRPWPDVFEGFYLGMAFVDDAGGWWVAREFLLRSWGPYREAVEFAELVAAATAITLHRRSVHIVTDSVPVRKMINCWRDGWALPGADQPRVLTDAAGLCAEYPKRFTVEMIPRNTTPHQKAAHSLSRSLSPNRNDDVETLEDVKTQAVQLVSNLTPVL